MPVLTASCDCSHLQCAQILYFFSMHMCEETPPHSTACTYEIDQSTALQRGRTYMTMGQPFCCCSGQ